MISNTATNRASTGLKTASMTSNTENTSNSSTTTKTTNTATTTTQSSQLPPVPPPSYENQHSQIPAVEISFNKRSPPKILFGRASTGKREHQLSVASGSGFNPTINLHMMDSTPDSPRGAIRSAYTQADSLLAGARAASTPNETDGSRGDESITDLFQNNLNNNPNVNTNNNKKSRRR